MDAQYSHEDDVVEVLRAQQLLEQRKTHLVPDVFWKVVHVVEDHENPS